MFGQVGTTELILILLVVLIVFGVGRLPEIGGALGKAIRDFRRTQKELDDTVEGVKKDINSLGEDQPEKKS
jgi:sec-independent protein translocase protein TatA